MSVIEQKPDVNYNTNMFGAREEGMEIGLEKGREEGLANDEEAF